MSGTACPFAVVTFLKKALAEHLGFVRIFIAFDEVERKPNFGCDFAELVCLCRVILWKTHIPVRTSKWPPRLIFAGACHGIVVNYSHG